MKTLQRWQIKPDAPYCLHLAADARLSSTDFHDDQIWEVRYGTGDSPALALQSRLGGRAGLVSIVPMWQHDNRTIYQAQAYTRPPILTGFAPGYLRFEASLTPHLGLQTEYWVMDSHAVGIRVTLANIHNEPLEVGVDVVAFVGMNNKEQALIPLPSNTGLNALCLGKVGNVQPVIALEDGYLSGEAPAKPRLSRTVSINAKQRMTMRLVHAGLSDFNQSLAAARKWLQTDWNAAFTQIEAAMQTIPHIETSDNDTDATIAFAYRELVQSILKPTASLPYSSFVATREPGKGYNVNDKSWNGQPAHLSYLVALGLGSSNPQIAQGILNNYLAVQQSDGWIDAKPGLGGDKQNMLCMPLLARLAWGIFQYTEDSQFLKEAFPRLFKFFQRWLQPDLDKDGDGLPEWQYEAQTGYVFMPTFASWQAWGNGADIRTIETPDLIAYLLSEARSLKEIAYYLRDSAAEQQLDKDIQRLQTSLEQLWYTSRGRYTYRDRDSHITTNRVDIITDARGADELLPSEKVSPPNRLIVRVSGGVDLQPKMTLSLDGFDAAGIPINETASSEQFIWAGGRGVYTSKSVFAQIDRVAFQGLSRVYRVDVHTVDTARLDINALLPLWGVNLPPDHAASLLSLLTDPTQFWRSSGVSMNAATDANYDPTCANGSGGVRPFWLTLMGEALIEAGKMAEATDIFKRILAVQTAVLKQTKRFSEFYHGDAVEGLGEPANIAGIVPLHLLMRVLGVRIISPRKVWIGGAFSWGQPVTIRQHGVVVTRRPDATTITFASGYTTQVSSEDWQEVTDPHV